MFKKVWFLIIVLALLGSSNSAYAQIEHFEKGDLLFRGGFLWFGHTGIYAKWDRENDPEERASHRVIEIIGLGDKVSDNSYEDGGVRS